MAGVSASAGSTDPAADGAGHAKFAVPALFAVALLANADPALAERLQAFRARQTETVLAMELPPPG